MELFEPGWDRSRLRGHLLWFGAWLGVTGVAAWLRPSEVGHGTHTQLGLPPCPAAFILHRPCPGCGLTTSWTRLLHGDIAGAFSAHWLGPVFYGLFTATAVACLVGYFKKQRFDSDSASMSRVIAVLVFALLAYSVPRFFLQPYS